VGAITTLYGLTQPYLPGVPTNLLLQSLRNAVRQFCQSTEVWREELPVISTTADEDEYLIEVAHSYDASIKRILGVTLDDAELLQTEYEFDPNGTFRLLTAPTEDDLELVVTVAFLPSLAADELPDWLLEKWGDAFAEGAKVLLKSVPGSEANPSPWFDRVGAQEAMRRLADLETRAKNELLTDRRHGPLAVTIPDYI